MQMRRIYLVQFLGLIGLSPTLKSCFGYMSPILIRDGYRKLFGGHVKTVMRNICKIHFLRLEAILLTRDMYAV